MDREQKTAVARIQVGASRGTGFLVGARYLVTALHVLADIRNLSANTGIHGLKWYAGKAALRFGDPRDGNTLPQEVTLADGIINIHVADDLALVKIAEVPGALPLATSDSKSVLASCEWRSFGFPNAAPDGGLVVDGRVIDPGRGQLFCEQAGTGDGMRVSGISGAPCVADGAVIGTIRESLGTVHRDTGVINEAGTLFFSGLRRLRDEHPEAFDRWKDHELAAALLALLPVQFEVVLHRMGLSEKNVRTATVPQRDRAEMLLRWVAGQRRSEDLRRVVEQVGGLVRSPSPSSRASTS